MESQMRTLCILTCAAAALIATGTAASAQMGGGGSGQTTRPSYDNPRDYDRDRYGNETYYRRDTWFGPRYGYNYDAYEYGDDRPARKTKKTIAKKRIYDDDDDD
jgi:hypothetical protein